MSFAHRVRWTSLAICLMFPLGCSGGGQSASEPAPGAGAAVEPAAQEEGGAPMIAEVGKPAPDFALPGSDGVEHALADHRGKRAVVIAWFPKAFTGG